MGSSKNASAARAIVALGNPYRGDDGVGPAVLRALRESGIVEAELLESVHVGLPLAQALVGYEKVLIVDGAPWLPAGRISRLALREFRSRAGYLHGLGLQDAFAALSRIEEGVPEVEILAIGIGGGQLGFREGLSPAVAAAMLRAKEEVMRWLQEGS